MGTQVQHPQDLEEIGAMMLWIDEARARVGEAASALRARHARREVIDRVERSERRLNQAVRELTPMRYR